MAFIIQEMCASSVKFNPTWYITKLHHAQFTHSASEADMFITQDFFHQLIVSYPRFTFPFFREILLKYVTFNSHSTLYFTHRGKQ